MTDRGPDIRREGGGGCLRSLFLLWLLAYPALLVLPPLLGGTQGAGGLAVGVLGSFAAAGLFLPWLVGLVILGLVYVLFRPSGTVVVVHRPRPLASRAAPPDDTKICPRCAETVKAAALVCRFCGHEFGPGDLRSGSPLDLASPAGTSASLDTAGDTPGQEVRAGAWTAVPPRQNRTPRWLRHGPPHGPAGIAVVVLVLVGFIAVVVLGTITAGGRSGSGLVGPSATPSPVESVPATALPVAATPPSGSATAAVTVVTCPATYGYDATQGATLQPPTPRLPAVLAAAIAYYATDFAGVFAPRGWTCEGSMGADGSTSLTVSSPAEPNALVSYQDTGGCQGCAWWLACPYFADASTNADSSCSSPPSAEQITRVSDKIVRFVDPAGVAGSGDQSGGSYQAVGALYYYDTTSAGAFAAEITCTLPPELGWLCGPIVDAFVSVPPQ